MNTIYIKFTYSNMYIFEKRRTQVQKYMYLYVVCVCMTSPPWLMVLFLMIGLMGNLDLTYFIL